MRGFGRQCRGQGRVFVTLVRHTERQLLALGQPIQALGQQAQQLLDHANDLQDAHRQRLTSELNAAMKTQEHIRKQSGRLTQGKKLSHCKIVNAYDPTIAPIIKGKSNCPAQFGRKPGIVSEPATGFIFANRVPEGNPSDPSYVLPLLDKVQSAIDRVSVPQRLRIHSVAGDLGVNETALRQALHARGILTVGIPKSVEPLEPHTHARGDCAPSSPRRAYAGSAPRTKCSWPVPVAIVVQWWKATSPVYSRAALAKCVTKACRALSSNKG